MSQITKKMIIDCTLAMAEHKSLSKISVRDIVEKCGITRNTFYYYFHDIYDVLDGYVSERLERINWNDSSTFFDLIDFAVEHKVVWQNLYRSIGHEVFSRYVIKKLNTILLRYIVHRDENKYLAKEDIRIICAFYEEAFLGIFVRWLVEPVKHETVQEMRLTIDRVRMLFEGQLELVIKNASKKEN